MPVNKIESINQPVPSLWRARVRHEIKTQANRNFLNGFNPGLISYVHNGDEFISIMAEDDSVNSTLEYR